MVEFKTVSLIPGPVKQETEQEQLCIFYKNGKRNLISFGLGSGGGGVLLL